MTRLKLFVYGALLIFAFNIVRILVLVFVYVTFGKNYFDALHLVLWQVVSTIVVVLIWLFLIKKYKIKRIPVYSDVKYLIKLMK